MSDYLSVWSEAVQAYGSIANIVKAADANMKRADDLAAQVEKLSDENYELKQRLEIALPDSAFRPIEEMVDTARAVPVTLMIEGFAEDGFLYVRYGLASIVSAHRVRLDSRIVKGWKPDNRERQ